MRTAAHHAERTGVTPEPDLVTRLFEIAAFERALTAAERIAAGLGGRLDPEHVARLWEQAALERPLGERERLEVELDLAALRAA